MRHLISIAAVLVHLSLLTACDGESSERKADAADKPKKAETGEAAASFKSATPVEVDAAELAAMYAAESKNTELQRDAKEEELKGKVVEWKAFRVVEVEKDGDDCFRLETLATRTHPGAFITACKSDDPGIAKLAPTLKSGDWIDVRGMIDGVSKRHIELSPATVARNSEGDDVTKICEKMAELAEKEDDLPQEAKKEMADIEKCKKEAGEEQKKDPEKFAKMTDCVMGVSDMTGVMKCAVESEGAGE